MSMTEYDAKLLYIRENKEKKDNVNTEVKCFMLTIYSPLVR